MYSKVREKVRQLLNNFEKILLTTDLWSDSCSGVSLLSFPCHRITVDFQRIYRYLNLEVFKIETMLNHWKIPKDKVHCVVRDSDTNKKKAACVLYLQDVDLLYIKYNL